MSEGYNAEAARITTPGERVECGESSIEPENGAAAGGSTSSENGSMGTKNDRGHEKE